jgi:hypothetical protein
MSAKKSSVALVRLLFLNFMLKKEEEEEEEAMPVTGLGGLEGSEMSRIPHCLDSRLIDGGKVVSPTHRPHFTPQKLFFYKISGTHFCYSLSKPQGLVHIVE